jgi:hypothetical protein
MSYCYLIQKRKNRGWKGCKLYVQIIDNKSQAKKCGSCIHLGEEQKLHGKRVIQKVL